MRNLRSLLPLIAALALGGCASFTEAGDWLKTGAKAKEQQVATAARLEAAKVRKDVAQVRSKAEALAAVKALRAKLEHAKPAPAKPVAPVVQAPAPVTPPAAPVAPAPPVAAPAAPSSAGPVAGPLIDLYNKLSAPK